jgi:hypothetical protein
VGVLSVSIYSQKLPLAGKMQIMARLSKKSLYVLHQDEEESWGYEKISKSLSIRRLRNSEI